MILNGFLNQLKNKSFLTVRFGFIFFLFFNMLILPNLTSAQGLELVIGHYGCTSNNQCNENQYCDIDSHVCIDKNPEPACNADLCDLDEICPETEPTIVETCSLPDTCADDEYFSLSEKKCIKREANCNYLLDGKCVECLDDSDCTGKQCDMETHTCKDFIQCNPTSGKVLVDGKCACRGNMTEDEFGICVCENMPEGGNPETCDCDDDKVIVKGKCMPICDTSIPGITGERDAEGNCLCKTSEHYLEKAVMNADNTYYCECSGDDASGDVGYYKDPNGTCMKCERTTKQWCYKTYKFNPDAPRVENMLNSNVNCETIEEDKWSCPYNNVGVIPSGPYKGRSAYTYYNPTIKEYCQPIQKLVKSGKNTFKCSFCNGINGYDDLIIIWDSGKATWSGAHCVCEGDYYEPLNEKQCKRICPDRTYLYPDGSCHSCSQWDVYLTDGTCSPPIDGSTNYLCANDIPYPKGESSYFSWMSWYRNTPASCRKNGNVRQTNDGGVCDYRHGCDTRAFTFAPCAYGSKVVLDCSCQTNTSAKVGDYCCAPNAYTTTRGCITCPAGEVVNAAKNGCEKCPANQISVDGKCQNCGENQYPNNGQTMCKQCKGGKVLNSGGTGCVCPAGTTEDPLTNTCVEKTL